MLDRDLAKLYETETRTLKQAVKRNIDRFPKDFMFELSNSAIEELVSQSVIPSKSYFGGAKPFAFTEQGVSMLSAVLKTSVAVEISLKIMRTFVEMRKFITANAEVFQRLNNLEFKQIETDKKIDLIFNAIEEQGITPQKGVFFDGQVFDAYVLINKIIKSARKSITVIDNYIDETILLLLSKRKKGVVATIHTKKISRQLELDIEKFNRQYPAITVKELKNVHDRFLIIDDITVYHFGASLKDLGKKWFAFSKMDKEGLKILGKVK